MKRAKRSAVVAALTLIGVAASGCAGGSESAGAKNLLLVVIDTLRAERLGCYGAERDTSPAIDAFARGAMRFERAYSPAPWTSPAVASLLTGMYPSRHGVTRPGRVLPLGAFTLAEDLSSRGYATAGVVSNIMVAGRNQYDQGFDTYLSSESRGHGYVSTAGVTRQAVSLLDRLAAREEPFFLFVLFFDPHAAYLPHDEVDFAGPSAGRLRGGQEIGVLRKLGKSLTDEELGFVRDLYDEEVRHTDGGVGELLEALRASGKQDETIVVLTSDHGEAFHEHGWIGHIRDLYDELVRVPLIVHVPGLEPGVCAQPLSTVGLAPTVLELLGLDFERDRFQAASFAPLLERAPLPASPVFAELDFVPLDGSRLVGEQQKFAVVAEGHKLIHHRLTDVYELYDLERDPRERRNLAVRRPETLARLRALLEEHARDSLVGALAGEDADLDEATFETLKGLGYAGD